MEKAALLRKTRSQLLNQMVSALIFLNPESSTTWLRDVLLPCPSIEDIPDPFLPHAWRGCAAGVESIQVHYVSSPKTCYA